MGETVCVKYSEAFKLKVVKEYEQGRYTLSELQQRYGIGGNTTISKWIVKLGRSELLGRKIMVLDIEEESEIKRLKAEVRQLQEVVSQQKIEVLALESLFEVAGEEFGIEFKKNCLRRLSPALRKKLGKL